jgi:hypothetical protein
VVDRAETDAVKVWEGGYEQWDHIMELFEMTPTLFNAEDGYDLMIKGNGKNGKARRYKAPIQHPEASPVGFEFEEQLTDLRALLLRAVRPWDEKAAVVLAKFPEEAASVNISAEAWGV